MSSRRQKWWLSGLWLDELLKPILWRGGDEFGENRAHVTYRTNNIGPIDPIPAIYLTTNSDYSPSTTCS